MCIRKTIKTLSLRNVDKTLHLATHYMLWFITIKHQLDVWPGIAIYKCMFYKLHTDIITFFSNRIAIDVTAATV